MLYITILTVGRLRQQYLKEGIGMYLTRVSPYAKITIHEVAEIPFGTDEGSRIKAKEQEGRRLLDQLAKYREQGREIIILDERGTEYTSVEFAHMLNTITSGHVVFVIGGALGLDQMVLNEYRHHLALSAMTFTHEMSLVILLEQVYRASTILKGKEYHY